MHFVAAARSLYLFHRNKKARAVIRAGFIWAHFAPDVVNIAKRERVYKHFMCIRLPRTKQATSNRLTHVNYQRTLPKREGLLTVGSGLTATYMWLESLRLTKPLTRVM